MNFNSKFHLSQCNQILSLQHVVTVNINETLSLFLSLLF
jgi:hypothetical protein